MGDKHKPVTFQRKVYTSSVSLIQRPWGQKGLGFNITFHSFVYVNIHTILQTGYKSKHEQ